MSNEFPDNSGLEQQIDYKALKQNRRGLAKTDGSNIDDSSIEALAKISYDETRDMIVLDASAQVKPSTVYLGSAFGMSNAIKAVGFKLADGTDALCMVNRFDPEGGSYSNPKFFALGGATILDVCLADSMVMPSPMQINYTTAGNNLTYSFEVKPASVGRLRVQYWLGGDDTGAPVVDFHYDVTQEEVDSGLPITVVPNFYILPGGNALFVRMSGISLLGNGTLPWFRSRVLPYREITVNKHTEIVSGNRLIYFGCDYVWRGLSIGGDAVMTIPATFKDTFTFSDGIGTLGNGGFKINLDFSSTGQGIFSLTNPHDSFEFFYIDPNTGTGNGWYWRSLRTGATKRVSGTPTNTDLDAPGLVVGDTKMSYRTSDHLGWYLLNGRAVTGLSNSARAAAASLGITTSLPDTRGRLSKANGSNPLSGSGAMLGWSGAGKIPQAALPNVTIPIDFTSGDNNATHTHSIDPPSTATSGGTAHKHGAGTLSTVPGTGNHEHTYQAMGSRNASGTDFSVGNGSNNNSTSTTGTGAHTHTVQGNTADESSHTHTVDIAAFNSAAETAKHQHRVLGATASLNGNVSQLDFDPLASSKFEFIYLGY